MIKIIKRYCLFFLVFFASGCAYVDPFEPVNRQIFTFNMIFDRAIFRPVARAYDKTVPTPVAACISNFFDNLDDLTNIANNALQFKLLDAWSDVWRFGFNTTFGLFGLFDVASCAGLPKHHQDFGLTLARYGFVNSPYLMIPFFGPSTIRDTVGWTIDWRYLSIWPYIEPRSLRYGLYGVRLVQKRVFLLPADKLIDDALDPYLFVRDAYLQKRNCDIQSICPHGEETKQIDKPSDDTFVPEESKASKNSNPVEKAEKKTQTSKQQDPSDPFVE